MAGLGAIIVFIAQYIFYFGKLTGKVNSLSENVSWIRDYLLCSEANLKFFQQHSAIDFHSEIASLTLLSATWKSKLASIAKKKSVKIDDPFDIIVELTKEIGFVEFANEAERDNLAVNTLMIASGIYYKKICDEK